MGAEHIPIVTRYCFRCNDKTPHVALGSEIGLTTFSVYTCRKCKRVTRDLLAHHTSTTE